jgi:hypothetical protein
MNRNSGSKNLIELSIYHHSNVIEATIKTIQDQNIPNYEINDNDNCSTDSTWERVIKFAAMDEQIELICTHPDLDMRHHSRQQYRHFGNICEQCG